MSAARDVIVAALTVPPPEGRVNVEWTADLIEAALIERGHLPSEEPTGPTEADYEETARWLAGKARFARYDGDGWTRLMQSEADVTVAFAKAKVNSGGPEETARLAAARDLLIDRLRTLADQPREEPHG